MHHRRHRPDRRRRAARDHPRRTAKRPPLIPSQLARTLAITTAATTALIDRLIKADLIARAPHPTDRRKTLLYANSNALPELQPAKTAITQTAQSLHDHDAALITTFLNNLSAVLEH
ncbi:MarR family protein [Curtobacterium sp. PhB191]|uniref:MarR family transcriptional regulator n=1 Tax=Curtobacterium sp. PhB191 TaxID=2485202 RepID=UPI0010522213|nr:MarR family transcriptional regulator [Curtobacterium sp. PhB191]TCU83770.1 MarR family protein [Curtobacterium sp. PhB191]